MATFTGGNNPHNDAHVDSKGRIQAAAVSNSEQDQAAVYGDGYNLNTGEVELTTDVETPLFYLENTDETSPVKIARVFLTFLTSDGTGPVSARVLKNLTGGTILSSGPAEVSNLNFGSARPAGVDARQGGTGLTAIGIDTSIRFLFTGPDQRHLVSFETIVLPRGASMALLYTPPTGNTSQIVEAGVNFFVGREDTNRNAS